MVWGLLFVVGYIVLLSFFYVNIIVLIGIREDF